MTSKYIKFVKDIIWFALGNLGSKSIVFIMTPIYARYLSQDDFGKMDLINSTIALLIPLISFKISLATFRFLVDENESKEEVVSNTVVVLIITTIISILLFPLFEKIAFINEFIVYFYLILIFNIIIEVFKAYLKSCDQVKLLVFGDVIHTIIIAVSNIILITVMNKGIEGYFYSLITAQIAIITIYLNKSKIMKNISLKSTKFNKIKRMLIFSMPLIPNSMNFWIMNASDRYILNYFLGYASTGVYAIAYKIPTIIFVLNDIFQQGWQIAGVRTYKTKDSKDFNTTINRNTFSFLIIVVSILIVFIKFIMKYFGGNKFYEAWMYTPLLLVSTIFTAMSTFLGVAYIASKDTKGALTTSIIGSIINIALNLLFIPIFGIQAAAISTLVSYFVIWLLRIFGTKKHLEIQYDWKVIIISILVVILQVLILFYFNNNLIMQLLLFIILIIVNKEFIYTINKILNMIIKKATSYKTKINRK